MKKMFVLLSDDDVPCGETALCEPCFATPHNQGYASEQGAQAGDVPNPEAFVEANENTMLFCCICDENICGEKLKNSDWHSPPIV